MSFTGDPRAREDEAALVHILRALWWEIFSDHATVTAAGLATTQSSVCCRALPGPWRYGASSATTARRLIEPFVTGVPPGFGGGIALLLNVLLVVWTAFRAASGLLTALNIVYDRKKGRSRLRRAGVALAVGVGGITVLFVAVALLAIMPLGRPRCGAIPRGY